MKKSILFLIVLALISACSNAPQVTATPEVTVTLPPPPTQTSIPTPTLHPDFLAFQGQIAQSGAYTLNTDGQIEMQTEEGMTMIPDIQIQPDGRMTFTYEGQTYSADTETLTVNGGMITFKDKANPEKIWRIIDGEWAMAELDINPVHTETAQGEFMGVNMKVNLITDKSLDPSITKIEADPTYVNQYGEKFNDAMLHFTAMTFYKVWLEKGGPNAEGPETEVSFDDYMTMWAEAQNGQRPWSDMQITILANEIATEGYDAKPTVIYPFYVESENVEKPPQGVRVIDEFSVPVVISNKKVKNTKVLNNDTDWSLGTNIYNRSLYYYSGTIMPVHKELREKIVVQYLSLCPSWLVNHRNPSGYNSQFISMNMYSVTRK